MRNLSRKIASILGTILFTAFLTSCSNNNETTEKATELGMYLDNNQKWQANAETTDGIVRLGEQLEEFSGSNDPTVEDYNELGIMLSETMGQLVDQCSMEGESHDQLHVFIVPIFKYIKAIKADDLANCKQADKDLTEHLKIYNEYFTLEG